MQREVLEEMSQKLVIGTLQVQQQSWRSATENTVVTKEDVVSAWGVEMDVSAKNGDNDDEDYDDGGGVSAKDDDDHLTMSTSQSLLAKQKQPVSLLLSEKSNSIECRGDDAYLDRFREYENRAFMKNMREPKMWQQCLMSQTKNYTQQSYCVVMVCADIPCKSQFTNSISTARGVLPSRSDELTRDVMQYVQKEYSND